MNIEQQPIPLQTPIFNMDHIPTERDFAELRKQVETETRYKIAFEFMAEQEAYGLTIHSNTHTHT